MDRWPSNLFTASGRAKAGASRAPARAKRLSANLNPTHSPHVIIPSFDRKPSHLPINPLCDVSNDTVVASRLMDYQTFNSPQPSFGGFSSAPTPPTTTQPSQAHSPSPQLYGNADPQARLHQQQIPNQPPNFNYQQPHFANGQGYPNTSAAGTPSLTNAQALQQQQLHHAQAQAQARGKQP